MGDEVCENARWLFDSVVPIFEPTHERLLLLFHQYLIVGGMPAAVTEFTKIQNYASVKRTQDDILALYHMDITKYAKGDTLWIKEIFDQVSSQLDT